MTQEEKAQAYDKIVNKLSKFIQQGIESLITRKNVQDFFPELAESEDKDERIRKELIRAFQSLNTIKVWNGIERIDIIAWLENQDKHHIACSEEQMKVLDKVLNFAANHESPYWNNYIFETLNNFIKQLKN